MTCTCGFEFCYVCGGDWYERPGQRKCTCDLYGQTELAQAADDAVEAREAARGRRYGQRERQNIRNNIMRDLERHEDCDHAWVRAQPSPEANCRNCHFYCHVYAYRCQGCNYVACYVCRFHRLGR